MDPKIFTKAFLFLTLTFVFSCEREYNNPWDGIASLDPNSWAPQNLAIEGMSITEKKLTWTYNGDDRFEGFKIDRKAGNAEWQEAYQVLPKEARNWTDSQVIPDPSLTYSYRVYAFAGKYNSAEKTSSVAVEFPAPTNVQIEKITDKSYKINWSDNSTGEQGFKIDRKIDEGNWVVGFGNVPANQTSFTDTNVFRAVNVEYRVYAFFDTHETSKVAAGISAELTAPADLQITQNSITSVTLSWQDKSNGEDGFKVERKYEGGTWVQISTTTANTFQESSFLLDTLVYYRVCAFVAQFNSSFVERSFDASIHPPTNLQIAKITDKSYEISWVDNSMGGQGFKIDRRVDNDDWVLAYGNVATNQTTFVDTNLFRAVNVEYRVYSFYENYESAKILINTNAELSAPTNFLVTLNSITSVGLSWQDNSNGEDGFKIERKYEGGTYKQIGVTTTNNYQDNSFLLNTQVYYRVCAYVGLYNSSYAEKNFNSTIPLPSDLQINPNSITSVTLNWQFNYNGEEGFKIDRKKEGGSWEPLTTLNANITAFEDHTFELNTTVYYRVCAYVGQYNSSYSEKSFSSAIPPPSNLQVEKLTDKSYELSWADNSTGEQGFKIDRRIDVGIWTFAYGIVPPNQTTFTDTNVFRAINVEYRTYAFYEYYESTKVLINANAELPAPTNLVVIVNSITSVGLSWQDNSNGEDGFKIERKYEGGNWAQIAVTTTNNYQDNNFELNNQVYYRICAFVGLYNSSYTEKSFNSTIPPPSNLQITSNSITSVTLNWQYNYNGEEGFKIDRKKEGGSWEFLTTLNSNITTFEDHTFELNTNIYYRVNAFVGLSNSAYVEKSFNSTIPPPTNLQITPNSLTSVTLTWQDNSNGEAGFLIDRKVNSGVWELIYGSVGNNQVSFNDNNANWQANEYTYRVYAFFGQYNSSTIESTISWPEVTTTPATNVTYNSAISGGSITIQGNYSITARGVCYSTSANPDLSGPHTADGSGAGTFTSNISTLIQGTNYNLRAYATNSFGTTYGNQQNFTTPIWQCGSALTDQRDNNVYTTLQIGTQCFMKENLAWLPSVSPSSNGSQTVNYYYVYDYQGTNVAAAKATGKYQTYGTLYNWPASLTACPEGWHLPSDAEWTTLTTYLGGESVAGGKMKETGTTHWSSPNTGATNSSGFTGLPGGYRHISGNFSNVLYDGNWWSSSEGSSTSAWNRGLNYDVASVDRSHVGKEFGFSVRCLRD